MNDIENGKVVQSRDSAEIVRFVILECMNLENREYTIHELHKFAEDGLLVNEMEYSHGKVNCIIHYMCSKSVLQNVGRGRYRLPGQWVSVYKKLPDGQGYSMERRNKSEGSL